MDPLSERLRTITNELKEYIEARIDLMVLNIGEQLTKFVGDSIQKLVGYLIIGSGLLFGLIALAFYLGDLLNSEALGFLSVSGILLLLGVIFAFATPKSISRNIQKQMMEGVLKSIDKKSEEKLPQIPQKASKVLPGHEQKD